MPATLPDPQQLIERIRVAGRALGFQQVGISAGELGSAEGRLLEWLAAGRHADMHYMARHGRKRSRPAELVPGTLSVISARMDYLPEPAAQMHQALADPGRAYLSRYALGRDYHKVLRGRLTRLAEQIRAWIGPFGYRVFVDSGPVLEKPLAATAGLGWQGKHTNLIHRDAGSWFFLGEIYCDLPLPADPPGREHCGRCRACIDVCPTGAIFAPWQLDARLCIAYLTIEHFGPLPLHLRPLLGNRVYGCDDCQLVCPWNRFARLTAEVDFLPRHGLDRARLVELFAWDEAAFLRRTEGSALRRLGHPRWLRNLAVALGNLPADAADAPAARAALLSRTSHPSPLVREHVVWALQRLGGQPTPGP